ncbi:arsenic resistance N-acetyltransferase ArsN2 [Mesorhizobium sp. CC13]|uniref:arsenic resistance N-acetyltransferase ArsN2 n=1 Tax=Mesorhizobium sp. CC13 TaxID=3029194 RepID=UPI003264F066
MTLAIERVAPTEPELAAALQAEQLPTDDLTESGGQFFRFTEDGKIAGFGGFEAHGRSVLLRSIVVLPQVRGQGIGRRIATLLLRRASDLGAHEAYLLTASAAEFFESVGFQRIERQAAPVEILATKQASSLCPSAAAMLMTRLPEPPANRTDSNYTETAP